LTEQAQDAPYDVDIAEAQEALDVASQDLLASAEVVEERWYLNGSEWTRGHGLSCTETYEQQDHTIRSGWCR
jgi:hypothetical protein